MDLQALLFWVTAVLTGASAVGVVVTQNIVRAAAWLLFALGGAAGIFFLLGADFVGATQLLVYVGGTLVLVVFGVMLTAQGPFISMKTGAAEWGLSVVVGLLLYGVIAVTVVRSGLSSELEGEATDDPYGVASMQDALGRAQLSLGYPEKAIVLFAKAHATFKAVCGPVDRGGPVLTVMRPDEGASRHDAE